MPKFLPLHQISDTSSLKIFKKKKDENYHIVAVFAYTQSLRQEAMFYRWASTARESDDCVIILKEQLSISGNTNVNTDIHENYHYIVLTKKTHSSKNNGTRLRNCSMGFMTSNFDC